MRPLNESNRLRQDAKATHRNLHEACVGSVVLIFFTTNLEIYQMLLLTKQDVSTAPSDVQKWLAATVGLQNPGTSPAEDVCQPTPDAVEPAAESEAVTEQPGKEEVLRRAADFLKADDGGTAKLKAILDDMGIGRVKECPDERLAELLARIAVA